MYFLLFLNLVFFSQSIKGVTVKESCDFFYTTMGTAFKNLSSYLPREKKMDIQASKFLESIDKDHPCKTTKSAYRILHDLKLIQTRYKKKIGVMLPLSSPRFSEQSMSVISGMHGYFNDSAEFRRFVIIKDSYGSNRDLRAKLAELILVDKVAVIIGGITIDDAVILDSYADKLMIPTLLLRHPEPKKISSRNTFYINPDGKRLAAGLARYVLRKKFTRIGVLEPRFKKNRFNRIFIDQLAKSKIEVSTYAYTPNDYESMEAAAKKMFGIDFEERKEEYDDLVTARKEESKGLGITFQKRFVTLPPIINIDAVFLPDHFRNVRHFIKIFRFLGVDHIPLIGNQQWRSSHLVNPPESFLNGSVFIDFVGSYRYLPPGIEIPPLERPNLLSAKDTVSVDFQLMGYRSISVAKSALDTGKKRRKLRLVIKDLQEETRKYFPPGPIFNQRKSAQWPGFLFRIDGEKVILHSSY